MTPTTTQRWRLAGACSAIFSSFLILNDPTSLGVVGGIVAGIFMWPAWVGVAWVVERLAFQSKSHGYYLVPNYALHVPPWKGAPEAIRRPHVQTVAIAGGVFGLFLVLDLLVHHTLTLGPMGLFATMFFVLLAPSEKRIERPPPKPKPSRAERKAAFLAKRGVPA